MASRLLVGVTVGYKLQLPLASIGSRPSLFFSIAVSPDGRNAFLTASSPNPPPAQKWVIIHTCLPTLGILLAAVVGAIVQNL